MQQICNKYATNMQQICNKYATNMQQICNKYATNMQQICNYIFKLVCLIFLYDVTVIVKLNLFIKLI
jgi:hypothetical protein